MFVLRPIGFGGSTLRHLMWLEQPLPRIQLPRRTSASINGREPLSKRAQETCMFSSNALDIVARLRNLNALVPVDRMDFAIARIAAWHPIERANIPVN
jgi:hypothetical protein